MYVVQELVHLSIPVYITCPDDRTAVTLHVAEQYEKVLLRLARKLNLEIFK